MHQDLLDEAFRAANRMAADRGISVDRTVLMRAVLAVGKATGRTDQRKLPKTPWSCWAKAAGSRRLAEDAGHFEF